MINLPNGIVIADEYLTFVFSRSSGPGGQNVNKVNTKVTLLFDIAECDVLTETQKLRILDSMKNRASKLGIIRISAQQFRTQNENRTDAIQRLTELLTAAMEPPTPRRRTKIPMWSRRERTQAKRYRSKIKQLRSKNIDLSD